MMIAIAMMHIKRKSTNAVGMGRTKATTKATTNIPINDSFLSMADMHRPTFLENLTIHTSYPSITQRACIGNG
jgi:hypothetical protein